MKHFSYGQLLSLSWTDTKNALFRPFSMKFWLIWLFIAFMAGQTSGGGSSLDKDAVSAIIKKVSPAEAQAKIEESRTVDEPISSSHADQESGTAEISWDDMKKKAAEFRAEFQADRWIQAAVAGGAVLIVLLSLLWMWLSSRFEFIWLDALIRRQTLIKKPFREFRNEGQSLFFFNIVLSLILLLSMAGLIAWGAAAVWSLIFPPEGQSTQFSDWLKIVPQILVFIFLMIGALLLQFYISHIVIPVMYYERIGFSAAWLRFQNFWAGRTPDMLLFPLMTMAIWMAGGMVVLAAVVILLTGAFLITALAGGVLYLILMKLLALKYVGKIFLIGLGVGWIAVILIALMMTQLPVIVFLKYWTLHFLGGLDDRYRLPSVGTALPAEAPLDPPPSTDV